MNRNILAILAVIFLLLVTAILFFPQKTPQPVPTHELQPLVDTL